MASILIGILCFALIIFTVGGASALFLAALDLASGFFDHHQELVLLLPVFGLATGLAYSILGRRIPTTPNLLHRAHDHEPMIPTETTLMIFLFTVLSQVFGASTGRESSAIQFGAGLAETWKNILQKLFRPLPLSRQAYIRSGLAAGFGAVFGVPWAGAFFALEITPRRKWPLRYLPLTLASSFGAHEVALRLGAHHKDYPLIAPLPWDIWLIMKWIALGMAFGIAAKLFIIVQHKLEKKVFHRIRWAWLRPAVGGLALAILTLALGSYRYNGLGTNLIESVFKGEFQSFDFALKSIFTSISSASGLKGGEVTPLLSIGASLGILLAAWLSLPGAYCASLGLISVFAASAHLQWTGAIMAWEMFGFYGFLPTFVVCWVARGVVGRHGLYLQNDVN